MKKGAERVEEDEGMGMMMKEKEGKEMRKEQTVEIKKRRSISLYRTLIVNGQDNSTKQK